VKAEELALDTVPTHPWTDTRSTLRRWNRRPSVVLRPWALLSIAVAIALLTATWIVATAVQPDPTGADFPGITHRATIGDFGFVLFRNGLVLTLHALACVAGFMAGSSLPQVAEGYTGVWRRIHELAGPLAIAFVAAATLFSLATQAYALGHGASTLSAQLGVSPLVLMLGLLPHALPELFALFLPLAAWTLASRAGRWEELLAATFVTTGIAVPILLVAGAVEVWVSPRLMLALP
jgi:hypothetical protein